MQRGTKTNSEGSQPINRNAQNARNFIYCADKKGESLHKTNTLWWIHNCSPGEWKKATFTAQTLIHAPFLPLRSLYCSPDTFCLFTPTPWPNLARMREIKSGLVKSLHFPALVSSIKLSLSAGRLRDAAKNKCNARRARRKARGHGRKLRRARRVVGKEKKRWGMRH